MASEPAAWGVMMDVIAAYKEGQDGLLGADLTKALRVQTKALDAAEERGREEERSEIADEIKRILDTGHRGRTAQVLMGLIGWLGEDYI